MGIALMYYAYISIGTNFMAPLTAFLALSCLMEAYKIYKLMQMRMLNKHYLFELVKIISDSFILSKILIIRLL